MTNSLAISNSIPIEQVNDLANRLAEFLPGARDLPKEARMTLAQIGLMHNLDPFTGEIWAIPQKQRETGQVIGFSIMIGIAGWRASAHRSGEYWGRAFRECTQEERAALGVGPKDLALRCIVMRRKSGSQPVEFDGYGIYRQGDRTKMNPLQCVRYRAERDAMKAAFPISLNVSGTKVAIVDDNGEIINGDLDHGPNLAALSQYEASDVAESQVGESPAPEPPAPEPPAPTEPQRQPQPESAGDGQRPYSPATLKARLAEMAERLGDSASISEQQRAAIQSAFSLCFAGRDTADADEASVARYLAGVDSFLDAPAAFAVAAWRWLNIRRDTGGMWLPCGDAVREATAAIDIAKSEPPF